MNILVTGASGFVGKYVVSKYLKTEGVTKIVCTYRKTTALEFKDNSLVEYIKCDLSKSEDVSVLFNKFKFDAIIHTAGAANIASPSKICYTDNILPMVNILKYINNSCLFVFTSSICAKKFESINKGLSEKHFLSFNTSNYYGLSKRMCELMLIDESKNINYLILRPPIIYGKGARADGGVAKIINGINHDEAIYKFNYSGSFSMIYVEDLVEIIFRLVGEKQSYNNVFQISDGISYRLSDLFETIKIILGKDSKFIKLPSFIYSLLAFFIKSLLKVKYVNKLPILNQLQIILTDYLAYKSEDISRINNISYAKFDNLVKQCIS